MQQEETRKEEEETKIRSKPEREQFHEKVGLVEHVVVHLPESDVETFVEGQRRNKHLEETG